MNEDDTIATILLLHKNKRLKHGGPVLSRERIRRLRIDGHNKQMLNYFFPNPVYPERYFQHGLGF
jgi:hypothetical protein